MASREIPRFPTDKPVDPVVLNEVLDVIDEQFTLVAGSLARVEGLFDRVLGIIEKMQEAEQARNQKGK